MISCRSLVGSPEGDIRSRRLLRMRLKVLLAWEKQYMGHVGVYLAEGEAGQGTLGITSNPV